MKRGANWRYNTGILHGAADYSVDMRTPVLAIRNGRILDCHDGEPDNPLDHQEHGIGTPGNWILLGIRYKGQPASALYMHLTAGLLVEKNEQVTEGRHIANSGNSGHTFGAHLHVATMLGHNHLGASRFDYLDGIPDTERAPRGVASNGVTLYPPALVFGRPGPGPFGTGLVLIDELTFGAPQSDSVKRLQTRLNHIRLDGGSELPVTGNYLTLTRAEVAKWQVQKDGQAPGSPEAGGDITPRQARKIFPKRYRVRDHA